MEQENKKPSQNIETGSDLETIVREAKDPEAFDGDLAQNLNTDTSDPKTDEDSSEERNELANDPVLPRSIFSLGSHPIEKLIDNFVTYPQNRYQKLGYFAAIDPVGVSIEEAKQKLSTLIDTQMDKVDKLKQEVETHVTTQKEEVQLAIENLESQIMEQEARLAVDMENVNSLESEKRHFELQIKGIKTEIRSIADQIGRERTDHIVKRIQELRDELREMVTTYEEVSQQKNKINAREFELNKAVYAERAARYEELFLQAKQRLKLVQKKLSQIPGLTDQSHQFLFWAGIGTAGAAGWLFSVYVVEKSTFSTNFLSFFFTRLFSITDGFNSMSGPVLGLALLACLGGILIITTGLAWLGQIFLLKNLGLEGKEKKPKEKKGNERAKATIQTSEGLESEVAITLGDTEKNYYRTKIRAGTFFTLWVQALPIVFLIGVLFILLCISGTKGAKVNELMSALAGQCIGTSIAFGVAGLFYIYLRLIIVPRQEMERSDKDESSSHFLADNWEIGVVIASFIFSMVSMVIWPDQSFVAILGFVGISLMTGLMIAYAVYYRGLKGSDRALKHEIVHLSFVIDNCKRPRPLYILGAEGELFKRNYLLLMQQLYQLSYIRNMQAAEVLSGKEMTSQIRLSGRLPNREYQAFRLIKNLKRIFSRRAKEIQQANGVIPEWTTPELTYFQNHNQVRKNLEFDLKEVKEKLSQVKEKLEKIRSEKTESQRHLHHKVAALRQQRKSLTEARERLDRMRIAAIQRLEREKDRRIIALRDGFDLGLWHRANDVEPTPKYGFEAQSVVTMQ